MSLFNPAPTVTCFLFFVAELVDIFLYPIKVDQVLLRHRLLPPYPAGYAQVASRDAWSFGSVAVALIAIVTVLLS